MFISGQKVVVVDDSPTPFGEPVPFKKGQIVTVAGYSSDGCVKLVEYPGTVPASGYFKHRFRPIVELKTDISIFQAMLTPSPVTVDALNIADHARELVQ